VAREENQARDKAVALLGNYDLEDEDDLAAAFLASNAERRLT
jgi:ABC-type branched-subunit amino acid transport system ATPase component